MWVSEGTQVMAFGKSRGSSPFFQGAQLAGLRGQHRAASVPTGQNESRLPYAARAPARLRRCAARASPAAAPCFLSGGRRAPQAVTTSLLGSSHRSGVRPHPHPHPGQLQAAKSRCLLGAISSGISHTPAGLSPSRFIRRRTGVVSAPLGQPVAPGPREQ